MEQQSNNSFDKLFRKVADKYPLNTNNQNWDIVAARLQEQKLNAKIKTNKKWQLAALLLLISFGSFGIYFYSIHSNKLKQLAEKVDSKSHENALKHLSQPKIIELDKHADKVIPGNNFLPNITDKRNMNDKSLSVIEKEVSKNSSMLYSTVDQHQNSDSYFQELNNSDYYDLAELSASKKDFYITPVLKMLDQNQPLNLLKDNKLNESKNFDQNKKSTQIKLKLRPRSFLYGTFFISPDFSTVKYQQVNAPGFKIGVQLGYRISNSFSAEISLVRSHSDFYTLGKYFDKSHAKINSSTTINRVYGQSKMTDVPFDIRYNFPKTNNHFFVTAGTDLILLTHAERYKYDVTKSNGSKGNISKRFSAVSGTKYFSNINVSAGYETPLAGSFRIKAEPYYQIPVKNFGIGSLHVTHFGVNIGIVKDLK